MLCCLYILLCFISLFFGTLRLVCVDVPALSIVLWRLGPVKFTTTEAMLQSKLGGFPDFSCTAYHRLSPFLFLLIFCFLSTRCGAQLGVIDSLRLGWPPIAFPQKRGILERAAAVRCPCSSRGTRLAFFFSLESQEAGIVFL